MLASKHNASMCLFCIIGKQIKNETITRASPTTYRLPLVFFTPTEQNQGIYKHLVRIMLIWQTSGQHL